MSVSAWGSAIALLCLVWHLSLESFCSVAYTSSLTEIKSYNILGINTLRKMKSVLEIKEEETTTWTWNLVYSIYT